MNSLSQGFVEVSCYVAAFEAADVMVKAADVRIARVHKVDGPCVCVICEGEVAACRAAVDAAAAVCGAKGKLLAGNVIPRPADGVEPTYGFLDAINAAKATKKAARKKGSAGATQGASAPKPRKKSAEK